MATTLKKNSTSQKIIDDNREAADQLLETAMITDNPETTTRLRVVAALLYGHDIQKIRRNLSVTEEAIKTYQAQYDRNGIHALMSRLALVQAA